MIHPGGCAGSPHQLCYWLGVITSFGPFSITTDRPSDPTRTIPIPVGDPEVNALHVYNSDQLI